MNKRIALLFITRLVDKFGGNLEGEALEVIRKELEEAQKQSTSSTNTTKAEIAELFKKYVSENVVYTNDLPGLNHFVKWIQQTLISRWEKLQSKGKQMKAYTLTSNYNAADTCRDPDEIHTKKLGVFGSLDSAKCAALKYRDKHFSRKDVDFFVDRRKLVCLMDICSYGTWLNIAEDEIQDAPQDIVEAVVNSTQQLKAEILRYADEGIELCFDAGCDERIATRFEKIITKLSAV